MKNFIYHDSMFLKFLGLSLAMALITLPQISQADVYKHVDEEGRLIKYSDQPQKPGDKPITLSKPSMTYGSKPSKNTEDERPANKPQRMEKKVEETSRPVTTYIAVAILKPNDEESIRANGGEFSIELASQPGLDVKSGHRYVVLVDGEKHAESQSATFNLENMDRGAHSISAEIRDGEDNVLVSSTSKTIYVLRAIAGKP